MSSNNIYTKFPKSPSDINKLTQDQKNQIFIYKSKLKHDNKYDYSLVNYITSSEKVKIICPIHGKYTQRGTDHLQGKGCPSCSHFISKP